MNILVNASNLKAGGGLQVADSICRQLYRFKEHHFYVVLSSAFKSLKSVIEAFENTDVDVYDIKNNLKTILFGRDEYLDSLLDKYKIDCVLTVFGPSRWNPRCPHLCGFARAQLVLKDSPYYQRLTFKQRFFFKLLKLSFKRSSKIFFTENPYISAMLPNLLGKNIKVFSVTNYYNQVFDQPNEWVNHELPIFCGTTLLTVSSSYPHKNLTIALKIATILKREHIDFQFRFVYTIDKDEFPPIPDELKNNFLLIGKVDIKECPSLYQQADIAFQPTLMECFTATYPEAMRMEVPIVTTDLKFAHGLCGDAACYYEATNAKAAADVIYKVATDNAFSDNLTMKGKKRLLTFDNYEQRADKLIAILERIVNHPEKMHIKQ